MRVMEIQKSKTPYLIPVLSLCLFAFILELFRTYYPLPPLSPDSWSYYEISKTIFNDFYRFSTFRTYENPSPYASSFPPLWPFLIAVFNSLCDFGPRTGVVLNLLLVPLTAYSIEKFSGVVFKKKFIGLLSYFIILSDSSYIDEVVAGRAIPLQIILLLNLFLALYDLKKRGAFLRVGMFLGLCLMCRFDALVLVPLVVVFTFLFGANLRDFVAFLLAFFVFISPWIVYSSAQFHSLWKSDNSFVAKAVKKSYVTDWYPRAPETLRENFGGWLERVLGNVYPLVHQLGVGLKEIGLGVVLVIIALLLKYFFISLKSKEREGVELNKNTLRLGLLVAFFIVLSLLPCLLTGYFDQRYFCFQRMMLVLFGLGFLGIRLESVGMIGVSLVLLLMANYKLPPVQTESVERDPLVAPWLAEIGECIEESKEFRAIFFLDTYNPFQFGAMTGIKTGMIPGNFLELEVGDRRKFLSDFAFSHILSAKERAEAEQGLGVDLKVSECSNVVYEIK